MSNIITIMENDHLFLLWYSQYKLEHTYLYFTKGPSDYFPTRFVVGKFNV
jgi:hypothetical protein